MNSVMTRWGLLLWGLLVGLSGCSLLPEARHLPVHHYRLDVPLGEPRWRAAGPVLRLAPITGQRYLRGSRIAYLERPHEIGFYTRSRWETAPVEMWQPLLVQALAAGDMASAVVDSSSRLVPDIRVETRLAAFEQDVRQGGSRFRVSLQVRLLDLRRHRLLGERWFTESAPAPSRDAAGGVAAANRASARLLARLVDWARPLVRAVSAGDH